MLAINVNKNCKDCM